MFEVDDVVEAIVDRSADHDLTVVGATEEAVLQQLVFGAFPESVGRRAHGIVIMATEAVGITGRLRQGVARLRPR